MFIRCQRGFSQLFGHAIKRAHQNAQLILALRRQHNVIITASDRSRTFRKQPSAETPRLSEQRQRLLDELPRKLNVAMLLDEQCWIARYESQGHQHVEVVEYAELGMEAVWKIEVRDFPAFILVDDKGNDFFTNACMAAHATPKA